MNCLKNKFKTQAISQVVIWAPLTNRVAVQNCECVRHNKKKVRAEQQTKKMRKFNIKFLVQCHLHCGIQLIKRKKVHRELFIYLHSGDIIISVRRKNPHTHTQAQAHNRFISYLLFMWTFISLHYTKRLLKWWCWEV